MDSSRGLHSGSGDAPVLDVELARLAALPLERRGPGLAELARRLEAELETTSAPLRDPEGPV